MTSPHLFGHNLIGFQAWYAEEAWETPNPEPTLFTVTKPGDDEVIINLQFENCPELMTNQQGCSTNVTPQELRGIMEWLLREYRLYEDETGENSMSLFYNQRNQENGYALYMSYLDVTTMGLARRLGTHRIEEYLVAYVQPSICQLLCVLARHNIEIDVLQFAQAQQHKTCLLLDHLDCLFLEIQGALAQMDHRVGDVRHQLDILVP